MAIDIGSGATARSSAWSGDYTLVDKNNPANATGTVDTWQMWFDAASGNGTNVEVATFFVVSGNNLSTRDTEAIGTVVCGSLQTFTGKSTDVTIGDYAGIYYLGGYMEAESGGVGLWYVSGDKIPCTNQAFSYAANYIISLYGTGTEAGAGGVSILLVGGSFDTSLGGNSNPMTG